MVFRLSDYDKKTQNLIVREFMKVAGRGLSKTDEMKVRQHLAVNHESLQRITDRMGITVDGILNPEFDPKNPEESDKTVIQAIDDALMRGDGQVKDTDIADEPTGEESDGGKDDKSKQSAEDGKDSGDGDDSSTDSNDTDDVDKGSGEPEQDADDVLIDELFESTKKG